MRIRKIDINKLKYSTFQKNKIILEELSLGSDLEFQRLLDREIRLLSDDSAKELWLYLYGAFYEKKTRWFLQKDHWMNDAICNPKETGIVWLKDNIEMSSELVQQSLKEKLPYKDNDKIFFFETEYEIIECSWKIFVKHWERFITYNNEAKIWCYGYNDILQVRPFGDIIKFTNPNL